MIKSPYLILGVIGTHFAVIRMESIDTGIIELHEYTENMAQMYGGNKDEQGKGLAAAYNEIAIKLRELRQLVEEQKKPPTITCAVCNKKVLQNTGRGKKRIYCSSACNQKAKRLRRKQNQKYQMTLFEE